MFNSSFLLNYLSQAPLALAFERYVECEIIKTKFFEHPVLDVGCGEGLFASILFSDKIDVGIDPNARELDRARELGAYSSLIQCLGSEINYPDSHFKTIFSNSVLEHIEDLSPVLNEVHRLLMPDGVFYATVPSSNFERYSVFASLLSFFGLNSLSAKFCRFYNSFWVHYHAYTLEGWKEIFSQSNLQIVESYTYAPRWLCFLNDFLVPTALLDKFLKDKTNKWVISSRLRRFLVFPVYLLAFPLLRHGGRCKNGGLVFISAKRMAI